MIVRFDPVRNPTPPTHGSGVGTLDGATDYTVIEILVHGEGGGVQYRIEPSGYDHPVLFDARGFTIVDGEIPSKWNVAVMPGGGIVFGPERWLKWRGQYSFWEDFFSGDPDVEPCARAAYEAERPFR